MAACKGFCRGSRYTLTSPNFRSFENFGSFFLVLAVPLHYGRCTLQSNPQLQHVAHTEQGYQTRNAGGELVISHCVIRSLVSGWLHVKGFAAGAGAR